MNINITFLVQLIVCISSIWVYIDASGHKIGKTVQGGFFNIGAGWWGVLSLLFWIIVFPLYLIKRKNLIVLSKKYPVEPKAREIKIVALILVCMLLLFS